MNIKSTTDFFNTEYCNWASYDNLRKIASLVDGQKNAARKVLSYILKHNQKKEIKVSQLNSKVSEEYEYLHGDMSGVIVNLAQNYIGTNNINLLTPEGNFGTVLVPEASAPRYIYTYGSNDLFNLFNKDDDAILDIQIFEGKKIESKFLLPTLPLLLINGANGISSGFAQKILPRNPKDIIKYLKYYLKNPNRPKKPFKNKPFFNGFNGVIENGDNTKQWYIYGTFERQNNKVIITELPIGYTLKSYLKILDRLEDDKKIISYSDFSENSFLFEVKFNRKFLNTLTDESLIDLLKLKKTITENYTVMTEYNTIETFDNISDILWRFIEVKRIYLEKRKIYMLKQITKDIKLDVSRYVFIDSVIKGKIIVQNREEIDVIEDIDKTDKIIKKDDSYEYLLNMPVRSMTSTKLKALYDKIKKNKEELDILKDTTIEELWLKEI
jgi:DNA topoisomerase-2